jgi:hypothetical protein
MRQIIAIGALAGFAMGCDEEREESTADESGLTATSGLTGSDTMDTGRGDPDEEKLDVGGGTGSADCEEGDVCNECTPLQHTPCDNATNDPYQAMGINCPGEPELLAISRGAEGAIGVRTGFGQIGRAHV